MEIMEIHNMLWAHHDVCTDHQSHHVRRDQLTTTQNSECGCPSLFCTGALHYISISGIKNEQIGANATL